jgi:hypothetical protein
MTALLSVYSATKFIGSCNQRCYDCKPPSETHKQTNCACFCICGGVNHAAGLARAVRNITERNIGLRRSDLEDYARLRGLDPADLVVVNRLHYRTIDRAKRIARVRLRPPPPLPLFTCEALADATEERRGHEGSGGGGSQQPTPAGRPRELGP